MASLFAREGLEAGPVNGQGTSSVLYLRIGRWLVQPRHLAWFMSYVGPQWSELTSLRYVHLGCNPCEGREPPRLIRYKEELGKIAVFDAAGRRKRALWSQRDTFERALRGRNHFACSNLRVPQVVSYDRREHAIEEELFDGRAMRARPSGPKVLMEVARFQATHHHSLIETQHYVAALCPPEPAVIPWLDRESLQLLGQSYARLEASSVQGGLSRCPVTWSHNDLSPSNVLGDDRLPICIDFEQSGDATIWFDPIYMYLTWEDIDGADLVAALELSHRLAGFEVDTPELLSWHLDLFRLELFQQTRFLLHQSAELPMARIHLLHRALRTELEQA